MYEWAIIFLIMALISSIFGYTGIAAAHASTAQSVFYVCLSLSVFSYITGLFRKKKTYSKRLIIDIK